MYLVVSQHVVRAVLIKVQDNMQKPVYYVNKTLVDVETRYLLWENIFLALVLPRGNCCITSKLTQCMF